jgi:hypothetical protein
MSEKSLLYTPPPFSTSADFSTFQPETLPLNTDSSVDNYSTVLTIALVVEVKWGGW